MSCKLPFKKSSSIHFNQLNIADRLFLDRIGTEHFKEDLFFKNLNINSIPFVIKIASLSSEFFAICKKPKYQLTWQTLYSTYGLVLSARQSKQQAFYVHDQCSVSHFDLLKGAYYYQQAILCYRDRGDASSDVELYFLKKAIYSHSIHALQRYINFLYEKIEQEMYESEAEAESLLIESIKLCRDKKFLELYGSYTYMMLAESYFRYAKWVFENEPDNQMKAKKALQASIRTCDIAEKLFEKSINSINNASFGEGLSKSNSLGFTTPRQAKQFLILWDRQQNDESKYIPSIC